MMIENILVAFGGSFLDRFVGDPKTLPHPVRLFGVLIDWADRLLNRGSKLARFVSGLLFSLFLVGGTYALSWWLLEWLGQLLPSWVLWGFMIFLANQCVSFRDLKKEALTIKNFLENKKLDQAKSSLKGLVGRDTQNLSETDVSKATIESVAESTPDGIIAPLFYLCLGGLPAALAFKAVNTMDSMIGHRDERYEYFGKTAARLDDVLGFLPARISIFLFALASFLLKERSWQGLCLALSRGSAHSSWNAGYPEASVAGALGIKLGGTVSYEGEIDHRPVFDGGQTPVEEGHIDRALQLSSVAQWIFLIFVSLGFVLWNL